MHVSEGSMLLTLKIHLLTLIATAVDYFDCFLAV